MSKKPGLQKPKTVQKPGSSGAPRPGSAGTRGISSKTSVTKPPTCPMAADKLKKQKKQQPAEPPPKVYENPAFSIPLKAVQTNPLLADKEKQKAIRRNIPSGEDTKGLKNVIHGLKDTPDITVGEFVGLVAPYTGDNGECLRAVMTDDMNSFRAMARKIYDTMTQDVSDVLTNQHIQLKEYEQERTTLYTEKMMRAINEIYSYAPNFDFEAFYEDKERYLNTLFPVPKLIEADSDEAEMHRRQQAFHRMNWLRTEGDRLTAENERLHQRLKELKKQQMQEIRGAEAREAEAEAKREELEAQEAAVQKQLEELTDKVEETMIDTEAAMRVATDEANITAPKKKASKGAVKRRMQKKPEWVSENAADIEEKAIEENVLADGGQVEVDPEALAGVIKRVRSKASKTRVQRPTTPERAPPPSKERSPFHFSPIKTPPGKGPPPASQSPFHYSPPPEIRVQQPPETPAAAPPQLHTTRLRTERVTVRERGPAPQGFLVPPAGGAHLTPQDSLLQPGGEDVTPTYQKLQATTPGAPARSDRTMAASKPAHSKLAMEGAARAADVRKGRGFAPKDTWGGYG